MYLSKKLLMILCFILLSNISLYSDENYTIKTTSLHKAIKEISKISKLPFIVDANILKNKKAKPIENIRGLQNALNLLLQGTGLEAIISNETIVIRKKQKLSFMANFTTKV